MKLTAAEGYLLSVIDGSLDEVELALMTGKEPAEVARTLDRLAAAGLVALRAQREPAASPPPRERAPSGAGSSPGRWPPSSPVIAAPPPSEPSDPSATDLDAAKRARIDDLFGRLEDLSYYEILGVASDADKKQVKGAYYALAPEFHPDKFFRRHLGPYKHKVEAIFTRITLAHDTLTVPERRADYDAYLAQTRINASTSAVLTDTPADVSEILAAVERAAAEAARRLVPQPPAPAPVPAVRVTPEEVIRQRREVLARKLAGGRITRSSRPASVPPPSAPDAEALARSAEAIRIHQERAVREAKRAQVVHHLDAGRASLEAKDWASAANNYRIAASLDPDDPDTQAACNQALQIVAAALADGYWRQGVYEEQQERWSDAGLSFSKVCAGRPNDAAAHDKVAQMTIRAAANLRRAVEFSRRAIELDPKRFEYRITLSNAYAAAGMGTSAAAELDRILELAPKDPRVIAMVAAAKTGHATLKAAAQARLAAEAQGDGRRTPPVRSPTPLPNEPAPSSTPAPASAPASPPPPKTSGLHALVSAVRSALGQKDGK